MLKLCVFTDNMLRDRCLVIDSIIGFKAVCKCASGVTACLYVCAARLLVLQMQHLHSTAWHTLTVRKQGKKGEEFSVAHHSWSCLYQKSI